MLNTIVSPGVGCKRPPKIHIPPNPTRGQLTALADELLGPGARSARIRAEHIQGQEICVGIDAPVGALIDGVDALARRPRRDRKGLGREGWAAICALYAGRERLAVLLSAALGPDQTFTISRRLRCDERSIRNAQARAIRWVRVHCDRVAVRAAAGAVDPDDPSILKEARALMVAGGEEEHQLSFSFFQGVA